MTGGPIRVVVADDHAVVREGIRRVLDDDPDFIVVGEASTGAEALEIVDQSRPDVVLLDLGMPDIAGLELARRLRESGSSRPRILVLSMHDDSEYVLRAVRAGVDGYLLKDEAEPIMLRTAVRAVHGGDSYFSATAAAVVAGALRLPSGAETQSAPLVSLTDRELDVLRLVASGRSNKEIASELGISRRTVETHRENLMRKLGIRSIAGLTRLALEEGLLDDGEPDGPRSGFSANPEGTAG
jgi:DNA-binding NarL/FixJ family response regulator